ncbi:MAG: copper-binding protein [Betaproteobacteria bacterium]|nr:copper-binding protein [Betaproteobacteria bacterium]
MTANIRKSILVSLAALAATLALSASAAEMADAEVRKIDKDAGKVTLKHGEIKNLEMPPMTMVFKVKEPTMLDSLKVGDKIKIAAEKIGGSYTVTKIEKPAADPAK